MRSSARLLARLVLIALGIVAVLAPAQIAVAHTDFDFSLPTDGAAVGEPVAEVTIGFTSPVTLIGPGFEVLDPLGSIRTPFVVTDDDTVFRLQLDPPLTGGEAAVRYEVRAEDGHTISGGFSFVVSVDAVATTVAPETTEAPAEPAAPADAAPDTTVVAGETTMPDAVETTVPDAGASSATTTVPIASDVPTSAVPDSESDGVSSGVVIALALAVAVGAGAFLVIRARASSAT